MMRKLNYNMRTFSSTASHMCFNTHTIHPRSVTSAIKANPHFSTLTLLAFSLACIERKNSKNHFVTYRRRRLSFSVILARSDLMSFSKADRKAGGWKCQDRLPHTLEEDLRLKQPSTNSIRQAACPGDLARGPFARGRRPCQARCHE
jgi:hypothetical protein